MYTFFSIIKRLSLIFLYILLGLNIASIIFSLIIDSYYNKYYNIDSYSFNFYKINNELVLVIMIYISMNYSPLINHFYNIDSKRILSIYTYQYQYSKYLNPD